MDKYVIKGGKPLYGEVEVSGAKNAAVAIIPAALMVNGTCRLENIPQISDADMLMTILEHLGAKIKLVNRNAVDIDCTDVRYTDAPYDLMRKIRASYYLIGAMLGRFGAAKTTMPGGCNFGVRPIDQHIKGMTALGADVEVSGGFVYAKAIDGKLHGTRIYLDKVSVGATMNIILAASMARGRTVIENAAKEPHIVDLANFLNSMGADVRGAGTDSVKINGADSLHGGTYTIIPDQIEAGTYMVAAAAAGGEVKINNVIPRHLESISAKLREMGVTVIAGEDSVTVKSSGRLRKDHAVSRLPDGYAAAVRGGALPCRRHEHNNGGHLRQPLQIPDGAAQDGRTGAGRRAYRSHRGRGQALRRPRGCLRLARGRGDGHCRPQRRGDDGSRGRTLYRARL